MRKRISDVRKNYRLLAEDVAAGRASYDDVRGVLAWRQKILRGSQEIDPLKEHAVPRWTDFKPPSRITVTPP
jgi:hypothetical protein